MSEPGEDVLRRLRREPDNELADARLGRQRVRHRPPRARALALRPRSTSRSSSGTSTSRSPTSRRSASRAVADSRPSTSPSRSPARARTSCWAGIRGTAPRLSAHLEQAAGTAADDEAGRDRQPARQRLAELAELDPVRPLRRHARAGPRLTGRLAPTPRAARGSPLREPSRSVFRRRSKTRSMRFSTSTPSSGSPTTCSTTSTGCRWRTRSKSASPSSITSSWSSARRCHAA